jgi:hypothetical protein
MSTNAPLSLDLNKKKIIHNNFATYGIAFGSTIFFLVIGFILANYIASNNPEIKNKIILSVTGIGITLGAFGPQLYHNFINKSNATDSILVIFLIMGAIGVLTRVPQLKETWDVAKSGQAMIPTLLLIIATSIPLFMHLIWMFQCFIYDSEEVEEQKYLALIGAICTIAAIIISGFYLFY